MVQRTPLNDLHRQAGAKMVDFAGWDMPLHYGSQLDEHRRVRQDSGMFDVSHMQVLDLVGPQATQSLRRILANDVARLDAAGRALYSCMLDAGGGVIDDLIVYKLGAEHYRIVVNAGTAAKDRAWLERQTAADETRVVSVPAAIIAVQGPQARERALALWQGDERARVEGLPRFAAADVGGTFVARTGYTGEDGFELIVPPEQAAAVWQRLIELGVAPCGLGARDTLRLEAGLNLYGQDMDESTTPLESNLGWTVAWEPATRDFIGRDALAAQRDAGVPRRLIGVVLDDKGVLRPHQQVFADGKHCGEFTSGSFSPILGQAVGFARIDAAAVDSALEVEIRGRRLPLRKVNLPFVRNGRPVA